MGHWLAEAGLDNDLASGRRENAPWLAPARHYLLMGTLTDEPDQALAVLLGDALVRLPPAYKPSPPAVAGSPAPSPHIKIFPKGGLLEGRDRRRRGAALISRDRGWKTMLPNCCLEEAPGCFLAAMGRQEEVNGLAHFVDGTVQVLPWPLPLEVRLIHSPAIAHRALLPLLESGFPLGGELLDPAVKVGMVNLDAKLLPDFFLQCHGQNRKIRGRFPS